MRGGDREPTFPHYLHPLEPPLPPHGCWLPPPTLPRPTNPLQPFIPSLFNSLSFYLYLSLYFYLFLSVCSCEAPRPDEQRASAPHTTSPGANKLYYFYHGRTRVTRHTTLRTIHPEHTHIRTLSSVICESRDRRADRNGCFFINQDPR